MNINKETLEEQYQRYLQNPDSVEQSWRNFFQGYEFALTSQANVSTANSGGAHNGVTDKIRKETNILNMILSYRSRGHLFANISPVRERDKYSPTITLERFHLNEEDLDVTFNAGKWLGMGSATLRQIIARLEETYCGSIGSEFLYIRNPEVIQWLSDRIEKNKNQPSFSKDQKINILHKINEAVIFEKYMHTKFVGQKRFSLEGSESIIPALHSIIEVGAKLGIKEFVLGMAHRGRLNILANILGKSFDIIFSEFSGKEYDEDASGVFGGDVKYHMGFSSDKYTALGSQVHLSMPPNPSHLEAINPVVEGIVGAKARDRYGRDYQKIAPILIHGDASIAGQGIIYEVAQMSELAGYKTGGTIHVVLNNQIGFTTGYKDARSSTYCTDIAKITKSPAFHVNGDDIEAVVHVIKLALEFRQTFERDVYIDIVSYRRHGHNEGDDPRFTQPKLYKKIDKHLNTKEIYGQKLLQEGIIDENYLKKIEKDFRDLLDESLEKAKQMEHGQLNSFFAGDWRAMKLPEKGEIYRSPETGCQYYDLERVVKSITELPSECQFFSKIKKIYHDRNKLFFEKKTIDWALGEQLAWGTLLKEGFHVRVSGQDVQRGTFAHRHTTLLIEADSEEQDRESTIYTPLKKIARNQGNFDIVNSLLSEYGVLGYEYGYAMASPQTLTIWEAQFGDFSNGAQIIIDQFISSAESKWQRMNGLVLLLPHGYEGQGPEHSSAKIERFLQLSAENNMIIANCTTPANFFHFLRRQMIRKFRKPAVVFTPKSMLRHPRCKSSIEDIGEGTKFLEIMDDNKVIVEKVKRVLFCSGKIYYDLLAYQEENNIDDIAIVRLEQLFPLRRKKLTAIREKYSNSKQFVWVQEEPKNMGAWSYIISHLYGEFQIEIISREESSATATGFIQLHQKNQKKLVERCFR
jgi:2-oxoglutarate dehydrogenase E1 component